MNDVARALNPQEKPVQVLVVGRPNAGKTSVFNRLTGHRLKTGNYHGVTVEHAVGEISIEGDTINLIDLPGAPSLLPSSPDEGLTADALLNYSLGRYQAAMVVVDALRLIEGLYFALHVIELGVPTLIVINQIDLARASGSEINTLKLIQDLNNLGTVDALCVSALNGEGFTQLRSSLAGIIKRQPTAEASPLPWEEGHLPPQELDTVFKDVLTQELSSRHCIAYQRWALLAAHEGEAPLDPKLRMLLLSALNEESGRAAQREAEALITTRFSWLDERASDWVVKKTDVTPEEHIDGRSDRIDHWLLHPLWGSLTFLSLMIFLFQALFVGADPFIGWIEEGIAVLGAWAQATLPAGLVGEFVVEGMINGVGNVLVFLPQVLILFGLIGIMEDSGYMSRASALMDRVMRAAGLSGRAFVPMLSGFICAVPAILATRTLPQRRDRLLTMMALPLLTCSARLPVYTLLTATLLPAPETTLGIDQRAWVMVGLYFFSIITAFLAVWVMGRTILRGETPPLILHLPSYRKPVFKDVLARLFSRAWVFIKEAGTVIFAGTVTLWILLSFPRLPQLDAADTASISASSTSEAQQLEQDTPVSPPEATAEASPSADQQFERLAQLRAQSYGGQLGRFLEPALKPLGWDWQVGVGLIGAFSAREVFVSTLGMVYGVGGEVDEESLPLRARIREAKHPDGQPVFTPTSALALLIFFSLACQCLSTLAAVKRETGGYRWPLFMFSYMSTLAYCCALIVTWLGSMLS